MVLRRHDPRPWAWLPAALTPGSARPRVTADLGPTVPAWVLRIACIASAAGCTLLVASHRGHWAVAGALVALMVLRPGSGAGAIFAGGAGLLLLASEPDPFDLRVALLVIGLHLTLELVLLTADLPWRTAVEREVLRTHVGPFVAIQAVSQVTALVGAGLTASRSAVLWVPGVAGAALTVLAWATVWWIRTRP